MPEVAPVTSAILSSSCRAPCWAPVLDPAGAGRSFGPAGRDGSVIAASPASPARALVPPQPPDDQDQGHYQPPRYPVPMPAANAPLAAAATTKAGTAIGTNAITLGAGRCDYCAATDWSWRWPGAASLSTSDARRPGCRPGMTLIATRLPSSCCGRSRKAAG